MHELMCLCKYLYVMYVNIHPCTYNKKLCDEENCNNFFTTNGKIFTTFFIARTYGSIYFQR